MVDISNIKNIAVIGAGYMGYTIAQLALMAGFERVILNDINMEIIKNAVNKIENDTTFGLKALESSGKLDKGVTAESLMKKLVKEIDLVKAVANVDFIIESIPEILNLKQEIFEKMGKYAPKYAIIATNTSSMSITKISETSGRPEKVIGMHFFPHAVENKLIEITRGDKTSDESMDIGVAIGQRLPSLEGKRLIIQLKKETPGFIANRVVDSSLVYINWAIDKALEKNLTFEQLDADIIELSPKDACLFCDFFGLDTAYNIMKYFEQALSPDFAPSKIFKKLIDSGNLGKKTGKGFYEWPEGQEPKIDASNKAGILNIEVILAIMLNEGCRLLEDGIVSDHEIIDEAVIAGYRLPGPFLLAGRFYKDYSELLENIANETGRNYLKPCSLMKSGEFLKMRK